MTKSNMYLEVPREKQINETEEYKKFSEEFDYLIDFFEGYSELIFMNGRIISFIADKNIYTLKANIIDSSIQTLKSIKLCCSIGSFSDANTLIRKLRDDLILYVYILNIIGLRKPFVEDDTPQFKIEMEKEVVESALNLHFNDVLTDDEQAVSAWFGNTVKELPRRIRNKLEFENYMNVLKHNENIREILSNYNLQEYWEALRQRLNNYVHNNGTQFVVQNIISARDKYLATHLNNINYRTAYVSSFFLVLLLMVDSSLISSTDYLDHVECNIEPPEGCQYSIAKFVQDFIDIKVSKLHPQLKQYLKDNNNHGMHIE